MSPTTVSACIGSGTAFVIEDHDGDRVVAQAGSKVSGAGTGTGQLTVKISPLESGTPGNSSSSPASRASWLAVWPVSSRARPRPSRRGCSRRGLVRSRTPPAGRRHRPPRRRPPPRVRRRSESRAWGRRRAPRRGRGPRRKRPYARSTRRCVEGTLTEPHGDEPEGARPLVAGERKVDYVADDLAGLLLRPPSRRGRAGAPGHRSHRRCRRLRRGKQRRPTDPGDAEGDAPRSRPTEEPAPVHRYPRRCAFLVCHRCLPVIEHGENQAGNPVAARQLPGPSMRGVGSRCVSWSSRWRTAAIGPLSARRVPGRRGCAANASPCG